MALVAVAVTLAAAAPAAATPIPFTGTTDQNQALTLSMAANGRKVSLHFAYSVSCASGLAFVDSETVNAPAHPTVRHRRVTAVKFSAQGAGQVQAATASGQQVTGTLDVVVAGDIRLGTGHATGRIEPTIVLSNGDKCTSGGAPIRWRAAIAPPAPPKPSR